VNLDLSLVRAIAEAVEREGGDMDDVRDLVAVWERQHRTTQPRADSMRREAANRTCRCADGGEPGVEDRCERCDGVIEATERVP
jgi:hypothetical protein